MVFYISQHFTVFPRVYSQLTHISTESLKWQDEWKFFRMKVTGLGVTDQTLMLI